MRINYKHSIYIVLFLVSILLTACGGGGGSTTVIDPASGYSVSGTITGLNGGMVLQDNGSDNLNVSTNGTFTFSTAEAYGKSYNVTVFTQPTGQLCTVTGGSGTVTGNVTGVAVNCGNMALRYAFTANFGDGSVSTFVVDNTTGRLKFIGRAAAVSNATSITVDPTSRYAYVAGAAVAQFTVGANGMLTPMNPATVAAGGMPQNVTIDPSGRYAYVADFSNNNVRQFTITANGTLSPMTPATVASGTYPRNIDIDPSGKYAYVVNSFPGTGGNSISQYTIGANGALTPMTPSTVAAGGAPNSITIDPSGKHAYVANSGSANVSQYTIGANGALTPMAPATVTAGSNPMSITVDPSGMYAYAVDSGSNAVSQYTIGAGGALTPMAASTVASVVAPYSITVDPSGKYVYAMSDFNGAGGNTISQYSIGAGGALMPLMPATLANVPGPRSLAVTTGVTPVQASPQFAYTANNATNNVSAYTIDTITGALTAVTGSPFTAQTGPNSIAVDPSGKFAYVANLNGGAANNISAYTINASTGALTPITGSPFTAGSFPASITVDPSGNFVYVANYNSNDVSAFTINPITGSLTSVGAAVPAGTNPKYITVDPSGRFVYVANYGSNNISAYSVNSSSGVLTSIGTVAAGTYPVSITVDASGQFVYVGNFLSTNISAYTINASSGALTAVAGGPFTGQFFSITVDPTGRFVYTASIAGISISAVNASTGALTVVPGSPFVVGNAPQGITIDASGNFAYLANQAGSVSACSINAASGMLTSIGAAVPSGTNPMSIVTTATWK